MFTKQPDVRKLKAAKNERKLVKALGYKPDSKVRMEAARAIGVVGSVSSLKPLCSVLEDEDEQLEVRAEAALAVGKICAWVMKYRGYSGNNTAKNGGDMDAVFGARTVLRNALKNGNNALGVAAAQACMTLPLDNASAIEKAYSGNTAETEKRPPLKQTAAGTGKESPVDTGADADSAVKVKSQTDLNEKHQIREGGNDIKTNSNTDLDKPVEIAPNTYWVGRRDDSLLERNIYLRIFSKGEKKVNLLIDPGPPEDLTSLVKKFSSLIGGVRNLHIMFLNHQDPDVSFNSANLQKLNPNCVVLCSEDSWRLVKFYGLDPEKYKAVESFKGMTAKLSTGHSIKFIPSPYCHFRGSVMLYDEETGVLFSGDLFGGLSFNHDLYATADSWEGIATFHQLYMPSQAALKHAVNNIRQLEKVPRIIAPQHGSILTGELLVDFMERVENLEVGLDLFLEAHKKKNYISALNELLVEFAQLVDRNTISEALKAFRSDGSFPNAITADANGITDIKVDAQFAVEIFLRELRNTTPADVLDLVDVSIVKVLIMWKIPLPEFMRTKSGEHENVFEV